MFLFKCTGKKSMRVKCIRERNLNVLPFCYVFADRSLTNLLIGVL